MREFRGRLSQLLNLFEPHAHFHRLMLMTRILQVVCGISESFEDMRKRNWKSQSSLPGIKLAGALFLLLTGAGSAVAQEPEYLLFGGENRQHFLGCLNCSRFDASSVWNKLGPYGSEFDQATIWSKTGAYGSQYKLQSPWHSHSFDAPEIRDKDGNSYGRFTRNLHGDRTKVKSLIWVLDNYEYVIENLNDVRLKY